MRQSLTDCAFFRREAINDYCVRFYPTIFLAVDCYSCSMYNQKRAEHTQADPKSINLGHLGFSAANPNEADGWSPETAERYVIDVQTLKQVQEHGK